ncbi:MAG: FAD-dependent oxidoreductase [Elusimicrobiota bacterium]
MLAYTDLIKKEGINCHLHEHPAYIYSDDDVNILNKENEAALSLGLPSSMEPVSISQNKALCFRNQAQFHSKQFMFALADKIISRGSTIGEYRRVIDFDEQNKKCVIKTKNENYESDYIVIATLFPIQDHFFYAMRLKPVLHHGIAYLYEKKEFDGMFIGAKGVSFRYYKDYLILVGADMAMGDNEEAYQKLDYKARKKFSVKEIKTRWSAHDLQTPDIIPFIGAYHPGSKRIFAATGFKAWGISHAMIASKIITDLIAERDNPWTSLYSPNRTNKILPAMIERSQVALKRIISKEKRCSHMGCGLVFNNADRTYDCPCHGSRFDEEGNVLWGPAVKKITGKKR